MHAKDSAQLSRCLVACNLYISAGDSRWSTFLLNLLNDAQQECTRLRQGQSYSDRHGSLAVVHAYADGPYDRSSFHIAGSSSLVASLASHIAVQAVTGLNSLQMKNPQEFESNMDTAHPTVGLLDHVAILPLALSSPPLDESDIPVVSEQQEWIDNLCTNIPDLNTTINLSPNVPSTPTTPTGWVARTVGAALDQVGVQVLWYGHADPLQSTLAQVRKNNTQFFKTFPASIGTTTCTGTLGQCTVGAPTHFVENYNIQVVTTDKTKAQSLTKWLRSRDGGLPFVEALTLPYGTHPETDESIFEVACNLLNPTITSTKDIDQRVHQWMESTGNFGLIHRSYRVGTTVNMCLKALEETCTLAREQEYNQKTRKSLQACLQK